jgi:hypothetical protein
MNTQAGQSKGMKRKPLTDAQRRRRKIIRDILTTQGDLVQLAQTHRMEPQELADWVLDEGNRRCLTGLCVLADLQTQVLMSRYRLTAATRLIKLASGESAEGGPVSADVARRACVDLLKLDLKRADDPAQGGLRDDASVDGGDGDDEEAGDLRALLLREAAGEGEGD